MLKAKDCPLCADIGVESKPRVGLFFGMYQIFAVCECTKCENAVIFDVGELWILPDEKNIVSVNAV